MIGAQVAPRRNNREFTGPTPHSVAIQERSRNNGRPRDLLIIERQRDERQRQEALDAKIAQETFDLKNNWENMTNRQFTRKNLQRKVEHKLFEHEIKIEERRNALADLLASEDETYMEEMEIYFRGETLLERQAKMRKRAKHLANKRENERLKIVEEKMEDRWRGECEELRSVLSRRHQDSVCIARKHQIETKALLKKEQQAEEELYAKLWKQDEYIKAAREEAENAEQAVRNKETVDILEVQVAERNAQRALEEDMVKEEGKTNKKERQLRIKEEEFRNKERSEMQKLYREELERNRQRRLREEKRIRDEEYELEKTILDQADRALTDEAIYVGELQTQRVKYERDYRAYIAQQKREETEREEELDKLFAEDQRREWELKDKKQREQDKARADLLSQVLAIRGTQVNDNMEKERKEKVDKENTRVKIFADVAAFHATENLRNKAQAEENRRYQTDLATQMEELKLRKNEIKKSDLTEYREGIKKEKDYQDRIKRALDLY